MPNENSNLPKEIDSNIIKEVLKQIGGADELITSVPDNTKLNIEQLAEIENKLTDKQKLKLNNMVSEKDLEYISGGCSQILKKIGKGVLYLGVPALLLAGVVFLGKKRHSSLGANKQPVTLTNLSEDDHMFDSLIFDEKLGLPPYDAIKFGNNIHND